MESLRKNSKTIIVLILFLCGFYFYKTYFASDAILEQNVEVEQLGNRVLNLNNKLESVELDQSLFSYSLYNDLVDFSKPIPNIQVYRKDPFRKIGQD